MKDPIIEVYEKWKGLDHVRQYDLVRYNEMIKAIKEYNENYIVRD